MKCKACNKKLSERRMREVIAKRGRDERRSHHNIYCDNKCYREYLEAKRKGSLTCPSCGQRKGRESVRCQVCRGLAVFEHMFDSDVLKLVQTLQRWTNPFETSEQLSGLSSGTVSSSELMCDAYKKGKLASYNFISERLVQKSIGIFKPIKRQALLSFSTNEIKGKQLITDI